MQHALATDNHDAGDLHGRQPAQVDVRRDPTAQPDGPHRHVGDTRLQVRELVDTHLLDRAGHEVAEDRQVVWCRVPPHAGVTADATHAKAFERQVVQGAEAAGVDPRLRLLQQRIVEEGLVDEQRASAGACNVDQLARLGRTHRQRFLHPAVQPGGQHCLCQRVVRRRRRGDDGNVEVVPPQQVVERRDRVDVRCDRLPTLRVAVAHGAHLHARGRPEDAQQRCAPVPRTDDPYA